MTSLRAAVPLLVLLLLSLFQAATAMVAQARKEPPVFDPADPEGLLVSPNPNIRTAWKRKVHWKVSSNPGRGTFGRIPPHTAAERQQMTANLDAVAALLKATASGASGSGFWVLESRTLDYFDPFAAPSASSGSLPLARVPLEHTVGIFPFYHEDIFDKGRWSLSVNGETMPAYYYFNQLPGKLDQPVIAVEPAASGTQQSGVEFYLRPRMAAQVAGLPLYEEGTLVLARAGRDPWVAVPFGRVLRAAMPAFEKDRKTAEDRLAQLKKKDGEIQAPAWEQQMRERFEKNNGSLRTNRPTNYEARLRALENEIRYTRDRARMEANPQEGDPAGSWYWNPVKASAAAARRLQSLTPEEALKPACYVGPKDAQERDGRYTIAGSIDIALPASKSASCREIVMTNWSYFDAGLPRSAPQILLLKGFGDCVKPDGDQLLSSPVTRFDQPPHGCFRHAQMWRELDWARFAGLVAR